MSSAINLPDDPTGLIESPQHGYRGQGEGGLREPPRGLTIAISREAGARGGVVARMVGERLGWQVFDQDMLDFLVNDDVAGEQFLADSPPGAREWADAHLSRLQEENRLQGDAATLAMVRLMLLVAAKGEAVLIGRGAGFLLPAETTLHVRVVAPLESRIAYIAQTQRLSWPEATAELNARDQSRAAFISRTFRRTPADLYGYDMVLNSTRLGIEGAVRAIIEAIKTKHLAEADQDADNGLG